MPRRTTHSAPTMTLRPSACAPLLAAALFTLGCASTPSSTGRAAFTGNASWYGKAFSGRPTASGEPFDPEKMTGAHRTLAFGTWVRVTHLGNGRSVVVRINDRGPFTTGRVIDLSEAAARQLGMIREGVAQVRVEVVEK